MPKNKCNLCGITWRDGLVHLCPGKMIARKLAEVQDAASILTSIKVDWPDIVKHLGLIVKEIEEGNDGKV